MRRLAGAGANGELNPIRQREGAARRSRNQRSADSFVRVLVVCRSDLADKAIHAPGNLEGRDGNYEIAPQSCQGATERQPYRNYHGNEKVFTVVMLFIASMTPSLMPRPLSFTPPNGELSMR